MKNFLSILFFVLTITASAQPKNAVKEKIDGKEYYIHTVEKGETVYGISKKYKVTQEIVFSNNPGAEKGLALGQKIKIPVDGTAATEIKKDTGEKIQTDPEIKKDTIKMPDMYRPPVITAYIDGDDKKHTVVKGETVYGIAKKYGVSDTKVYEWNPELKNGLKEGMVLIIKNENPRDISITETKPIDKTGNGEIVLVEHVIQKNETVFSICNKYKVSTDSLKLYNNDLYRI